MRPEDGMVSDIGQITDMFLGIGVPLREQLNLINEGLDASQQI